MRKATLILLALWPAVAGVARGDSIELKEGRRIRGVILGESKAEVRMATAGGSLSISRAQIEGLTKDTEGKNALLRGEIALGLGKAIEAESQVLESLRRGMTRREVRAWLVGHRESLERALTPKDPAALAGWIELTQNLAPDAPVDRSDPTPTTLEVETPLSQEEEFLLAMAATFHALSQDDVAVEMLEHLDRTSFLRAARGLKFVEPLVVQKLKERLNESDFEGASILLGHLEGSTSSLSDAARKMFLLRWASDERGKGNYDAALQILSSKLKPLSLPLAKERMAATLAIARDRLSDTGAFEEAITLLETWGEVIAPDAQEAEMALLYRDWGQFLLDEGDPGSARRIFEKYYRLRPSAEPKWLDLCSFHERFEGLKAEDHASAFELAQWAAAKGLVSEAIDAYERAAAHSELRRPAEREIALLQDQIAVAHMEKCMELFDSGEPALALSELEKFHLLPGRRKVAPEIKKLRRLCDAELRRRSALRGVLAETHFEDARRRFFLGETRDAMKDLELILKQYGGTKVIGRVQEFLRYAEMRAGLKRLEGAEPSESEATLPPAPGSALDREVRDMLENLDLGEGARTNSTSLPKDEPAKRVGRKG